MEWQDYFRKYKDLGVNPDEPWSVGVNRWFAAREAEKIRDIAMLTAIFILMMF